MGYEALKILNLSREKNKVNLCRTVICIISTASTVYVLYYKGYINITRLHIATKIIYGCSSRFSSYLVLGSKYQTSPQSIFYCIRRQRYKASVTMLKYAMRQETNCFALRQSVTVTQQLSRVPSSALRQSVTVTQQLSRVPSSAKKISKLFPQFYLLGF